MQRKESWGGDHDGDDAGGDDDNGEASQLSPPLDQEWLLQLWEPPTEDAGAPPLPREGQVVWMTQLTPRPRWRNDPLELSRPQLSGGRATAWGLWDESRFPPLAFECPARRSVDLSRMASLPRGADFDFEGVLVAAGPVRAEGVVVTSALASAAAAAPVAVPDRDGGGGDAGGAAAPSLRPPDAEQWLFCADAAALALIDSGVPSEEVWLLAVRVSGPLAAAPFLFPPPATRRSKVGGGGSGGGDGTNPSSSCLAGLPVRIRDARLALAPDDRERLWRAEARDTAVVTLVGGGGHGGNVGGGSGSGRGEGLGARAVAAFGSRVAALLGS